MFTNRHSLSLTESNVSTIYFQIFISIEYTTNLIHYINLFLNIWLGSAHYTKQATFYAHAILTGRSTLVFRRLELIILSQGCTNSGRQVALASKFFTTSPNIYGPSVCKLLRVTVLEPRILMWPIKVWKCCAPLYYHIILLFLHVSDHPGCIPVAVRNSVVNYVSVITKRISISCVSLYISQDNVQ